MLAASEKYIGMFARAIALIGGVVLLLLAIITVVSVTGRALLDYGLRPIPGDFELVEAGTAFVVCAFLPLCQFNKGHASVAVFTDFLGKRLNQIIDLITETILFCAASIMTWRHVFGMLDKQNYSETTFILRYPLWWSYAGAVVGLVAWMIVAAWCVANAADILINNKSQPNSDSGIAQ